MLCSSSISSLSPTRHLNPPSLPLRLHQGFDVVVVVVVVVVFVVVVVVVVSIVVFTPFLRTGKILRTIW